MLIPQLTKYILEELERGTPELEIKQKLFQTHWMPEDIEENYQYAMVEAQKLLTGYQSRKKIKKGGSILGLVGGLLILAALFLLAAFIIIFWRTVNETPPEEIIVSASSTPTPLSSEQPLIAVYDPLDRQRENHRIQIRDALVTYYEDNGNYPARLSDLSEKYLLEVPLEPQTSNPYKYETLSGGQDYKLCIPFEEVGEVCVNRISNE